MNKRNKFVLICGLEKGAVVLIFVHVISEKERLYFAKAEQKLYSQTAS